MAQTDLSLGKGTKVHIEGTPEEVAELLTLLGSEPKEKRRATAQKKATSSKKSPRRPKPRTSAGPQTQIGNLISDRFFSSPKNLAAILNKLAEKGHIYDANEVSTPIRRLVISGRLDRQKVDGVWLYQEPQN